MAVDRKALLYSGQELFVVIDLEIGMNAPLHKYSGAAERQGFFDLLVDHVIREDVGFGVSLHPIEGTECAELFADVRIVDIPINDVADHIVRMPTNSNLIRGFGQIEKICVLKEHDCLLRRHSCSFNGIEDRSNVSHRNSSGLAVLMA